jgi:hypothetical protein
MPYIRATDRPVFIAVGDPIVASFQMEAGGLTLTGLPLIYNVDENEFLAAVIGKAGTYQPLPTQGEWCEAGLIYGYAGGLVICRQSHSRTEHAPEDIPALFAVYRVDAGEALEWVAGEQVYVGTRRLYLDVLYECLQAHQTQSDWTPLATLGTLWGIVSTTAEWAIGVLYHVGDHVTYGGFEWICGQQHTSISTWYPGAPGVYLWTQV